MPSPKKIQSADPIDVIQSKNPWTVSDVNGVKYCRWPVAALAANGNPVVMFAARASPFAVGDTHVYLIRHLGVYRVTTAIQIFTYNTPVFGLVNWQGKLLAVCCNSALNAVGSLVYRTSADNGQTWSAEATLISGFTKNFSSGITNSSPAFWLATNLAGTSLYVFYYSAGTTLAYRTTTSVDPSTGWSAETPVGLTTGTPNFNMGNDTGEGTEYRAFVFTETLTTGTWAVQIQDGGGAFADRKTVHTGTLGGAWSMSLNMGYSGGLSGDAGANGGVFRGRDGRLLGYAMDDQVTSFGLWYFNASTGLWVGPQNEVPASPVLTFGQGQGLYVPNYNKEIIWGQSKSDGTLRMLFVDGTIDTTVLFGGV
ncbi:MAG TPA: hypothetical protein VFK94_06435 [Patescibacteria group bacterium]|nr:hypothetical protein [Patescibacteria group bacterium]